MFNRVELRLFSRANRKIITEHRFVDSSYRHIVDAALALVAHIAPQDQSRFGWISENRQAELAFQHSRATAFSSSSALQ